MKLTEIRPVLLFAQSEQRAFDEKLLALPEVRRFGEQHPGASYSLAGRVLTLKSGDVSQTVTLPNASLYDWAGDRAHEARYSQMSKEQIQGAAKTSEVAAAKLGGTQRSLFDAALSLLDIASSFGSFIRYVVALVSGPNHSGESESGMFLGGSWFVFSGIEFYNGLNEMDRAQLMRDGEGVVRSFVMIVSGFVNLLGSTLYTMAKAGLMAAKISPIADAFFGVSSAITAVVAGARLGLILAFRSRLNEKCSSDEKDLPKALSFLLDEAIGNREEGKPNGAALAERQAKYFKRRTSALALKSVLSKAPGLLERLKDPTDTDAVKEAKELIALVKRENTKKAVLFVFVMIASFLAIAGIVLGTIATYGTLPFILYAISVLISLSLTGYNLLYRRPAPEKPKELDLTSAAFA